jgi:hypothetical protein
MSNVDFVTMPMRWQDMEPKEGKYNVHEHRPVDRVGGARREVAGLCGPAGGFPPPCTPDWLYIWENDYETLRDLVVEHMQSIVTRYRRTIRAGRSRAGSTSTPTSN